MHIIDVYKKYASALRDTKTTEREINTIAAIMTAADVIGGEINDLSGEIVGLSNEIEVIRKGMGYAE